MSGTDDRYWMPPEPRKRLVRNRVRNWLYVVAGGLAFVGAIALIIIIGPDTNTRLELVTASGAEVELCALKAGAGEDSDGRTMTIDATYLDEVPVWHEPGSPSEQSVNVIATSFRATMFDEDGAVIDTFTNTAVITVDRPWAGVLIEPLGEGDLPSYEQVSAHGGC